MNTFFDLVKQRQSVRKYKTGKVPYEQIMQCVEAVRLAPSACNAQPWHLIVADDEALKNKLADCAVGMGMNKFCPQASAIVAVVQEKPNATSKIGSVLKGKDYTLMDIGIAAAHFCLQAAEFGLGTCIVGWFDEKKARQLLGVPKNKRIPLLITIGYPDDTAREKIRKTQDKMSSRNGY